ncbi:hypothetical protein [Ktedonospora formicarum]|uniref:Transcription elongation factor GreA n=1 Tax=Ktedonospora formicarum TaxID=2778364 RepID=A0A8J3I5K4_9CHLR|nr:hypothetical protein [Ktedonospora formicarum]GHO45784.1 hypothetical protein KSX_39470 [Ktedonospora formicarum]
MENESEQRNNRLTPEKQTQLKKQLDDLIQVKRKEVADYIRDAEKAGVREGAEYEDALSEQALIEKQIKELENLLEKAEE